MFGIIKHNRLKHSNYLDYKRNYCAVCKTIGRLYGHKERFVLNNDVVFLNELLSEINNTNNNFECFQKGSCIKLPKPSDNIPKYIVYTSSINFLLGYYKIIDNILDSRYKINIWRIVRKFENRNFHKALSNLKNVGFDQKIVGEIVNNQFAREKSTVTFEDFDKSLKHYSELSGVLVGEIYRHGVTVSGHPDLSETFYNIGKLFGESVYIFDALKDYESDLKKGQFNVLSNGIDSSLVHSLKLHTQDYINRNVAEIIEGLKKLPISEQKIVSFSNRLINSFKSANGVAPVAEKQKCHKSIKLSERIRYATLASRHLSYRKKGKLQRGLTFAFASMVLIVAFIMFPNIINAESLNDSMQSGFCSSCGGCVDKVCCCCCEEGDLTCNCGETFGGMVDETSEKHNVGCCGGCCVMLLGLGCIGSCCSSDEGPTKIVKVIFVESDRGCCGR